MARTKATLTVDRDKLRDAMDLTGRASMSEVIDLALDRLVRTERLRRDVAAYTRDPLTDEELGVGDLEVHLELGDEDVDYEALYGTKT